MSFKPALGVCFAYNGKELMIKSVSTKTGEITTINLKNRQVQPKVHSQQRIEELIQNGELTYLCQKLNKS